MLGRYLYLSFLPIIYIVFLFIKKMEDVKIYRILAIFTCILCLENILTYTETKLSNLVGIMCEYDTLDITNNVSYDITLENEKIIAGVVDPQITFLDELTDEYTAVEFELDIMNGLGGGVFVMYYAVDDVFSEEYKFISYYDTQDGVVRFIFSDEIELTNIRLDPPAGSSFVLKEIRVIE